MAGTYIHRLVDGELGELLTSLPAIALEGRRGNVLMVKATYWFGR